VSHDIRTPLATIAGAASSLVEANENSLDVKTCKEMASEIYGQSVRLNNLVTNLLDMTKIQSGGLKPNCSWQAVDDIIGATLNIMESRLQTRKVSINLPDKIPMLRVDPVLIQQVLINLLDNALKYTPEGSPLQIEVIAVCSKEDHKHGCEDGRSLGKSMDFAPELEDGVQEILISIKDEGPGISEDRVELIFDKFVRGENPHADGGSGLGLSICKAIVEAHGGKIWMENLSPRGSKFCLSLKNDNR
jgi:two-component system sensor histidine kinase KdpD